MKITIVSDSHGNYRNLVSVFTANRDSDIFIHAGDGEDDVEELSMYEPALYKKLVFVGGNCDMKPHPRTKVIDAGGVKIFITHGHRFSVNTDKSGIARAAADEDCQAAVFGHTHMPFCDTVEGIFLLNPGSCDVPDDLSAPTYAVLTITDGKISAEHFKVRP